MSTDLFRCDYCGGYAELHVALIYWTEGDTLDGERQLWLPAVYCSPYCGRTASARAGSGRG